MFAVIYNAETRTVARDEITKPSLEYLQSIVDGLIEPIFTIDSPVAQGEITGYVNEEGLLIPLPISGSIVFRGEYQPFAGNLIVVGLTRNGESRGLTAEEADKVTDAFDGTMLVVDDVTRS